MRKYGDGLAITSLLVLLFLAGTIGGGGVRYALANLTIQLAAICILFINRRTILTAWHGLDIFLKALIIASILLPVMQIIPLPYAWWTSLPGRELVSESLSLIVSGVSFRTISVDLARTIVAFAGLLPPLAVLLLVCTFKESLAVRVSLIAVLGIGLLGVAIGAVQLATANNVLYFYDGVRSSQVYGTFANRNSAALFFVICMIVSVGGQSPSSDKLGRPIIRVFLATLFLLAALLTQSRSGAALLAIPLVFAAAVFAFSKRGGRRFVKRKGRKLAAVTIIAALSVLLALAVGNSRISETADRFANLDDNRSLIWSDTIVATKRYWPVGSGVGTFDEVFQVDESLEATEPRRAGRAHNDYLEFALETGAFGMIIIIGWTIFFLRSIIRSFSSDQRSWFIPIAALSMAAIALQSIVDYPLRNQTLFCIAALFAGILSIKHPNPKASIQ